MEMTLYHDGNIPNPEQTILLAGIRFQLSRENAMIHPIVCHTKLPVAANLAVSLAREGKTVLLSVRSGDLLEPYRLLFDEVAAASAGSLHIGSILNIDDDLFADEYYDAIFFASDNEENDGVLAGMSEEEIDFVKRNLLYRAYQSCNLFHVGTPENRLR